MSSASYVRDRVWKRSDAKARLVGIALRPLSWLFGAGVGLRRAGYRIGLLRSREAAIPVVSVGNLTVGGTGKTPLTLWLARSLAERGYRPAIVSRGYGGSARGVTVVSEGAGPLVSAELGGDEPVMMARGFSGVVVTSAKRIDGVARAAELGCNVAVLDDGFQHRALARRCDLVLYDGQPGPLLPAGPYRERTSALERADAIILTGDEPLAESVAGETPCFRMTSRLGGLVESDAGGWRTRSVGDLAGKRVVAIAGIANPQRFYATLHQWDVVIEEVYEFADHHKYTRADWQEISRRGQECDLLVTTEKDLVKLAEFPFARGKLVALRIEPEIEDDESLLALVEAKVGDVASDADLG